LIDGFCLYRTFYKFETHCIESSLISTRDAIMDKENWEKILSYMEKLCSLHEDAICNYEKCREFASRMADFITGLEDIRCYQISDMAMDALGYCNPKVASHCETAHSEKDRLEFIRQRIMSNLKQL